MRGVLHIVRGSGLCVLLKMSVVKCLYSITITRGSKNNRKKVYDLTCVHDPAWWWVKASNLEGPGGPVVRFNLAHVNIF